MKNLYHILFFTFVCFGLISCKKSEGIILEKGGPVKAEGYVDLSPPTSYSPQIGVICESYSVANDGSLTGECFDPTGPSVIFTLKYISKKAAETLQTDILDGRFDNPHRFETKTGLVCDLQVQKCWFKRLGKASVDAPKHTRAMFWE